MRKCHLLINILIATALIFQGCQKNMVEEEFIPIVKPVKPDFTTIINTSVNGFITDENGNAVQGASIRGGSVTVSSDQYGYFSISNADFAKSAGFVQVSKSGYFTGYRSFLPIAGKQTFIRLQLIPKIITGNLESATGGTVSTADGAKITIPANAVITASGNTAYTGVLNISAHWLNPADILNTSITMPGDLTGVDSADYLNVLQTYGMLAVELNGSNGELLQIAPGKKAMLHFPIPSSLQSTAPTTLPLWYFNETKGLWIQEGRAVKNGSSYEGEVGHFSFWNCDMGLPLVNFSVQVVDSALNPLSNVPVSVSITGQPNSERITYTDVNGNAVGLIPANSNLSIDIIAPCAEKINFKTITTVNTAVDLGTVKVSLHQYSAVLQGTVTKCNGSPVTDGYVVVVGFGANTFINIQNGSFSAAGTICPGTAANFIAYDRESAQQSTIQTVDLITGLNNVGTLQACNISNTETITISNSTIMNSYTLPQHLFGGNFYFLNDSTSINAIDLLNGNQEVVQFSFTGPAAPGTYPLSGNHFTEGGLTCTFTSPTNVTINSYGLVGQFISGSISGTGAFASQPVKTYSIQFNIKRDQ